jgi:glyoxylase-like metal-dependent hydrolase (beta-lactamase superfamily II)
MSPVTASRRDFIRAVIGGAAGLSFTWRAAGQAVPPPIKVEKLTANLAAVSGDGGNVGLVMSSDGLMMIDGGYANRFAALQQAVSETDAHPIKLLFNTHWHVDHVGANVALGRQGVQITAHQNCRKWLSQRVVSVAFASPNEALPAEGLPRHTFNKGGKMTWGKQKITYVHYPLAHTDSDVHLFFPGDNVLQTGDLFFNKTYPVIDYTTGGWIGGMHMALESLLKVGDAKTRIIPGHGPLATREDMKATRDTLQVVHERLESASKAGKTMDDVLNDSPISDLNDKWGRGFMAPDRFLKMAYPSIANHAQGARAS